MEPLKMSLAKPGQSILQGLNKQSKGRCPCAGKQDRWGGGSGYSPVLEQNRRTPYFKIQVSRSQLGWTQSESLEWGVST